MLTILKNYINSSNSIMIVLVLELLAIVSFSLGGINLLFYCLGIFLSILILPFLILFTKRNELKYLLLNLIPLILMCGFLSFGKLYNSSENLLNNIAVFLGLISFFIIGYSSRRIRKMKIEYVLGCIGIGLSLLVIISILYSLYNYGAFHTLLWKDTPYYYYYGEAYNITLETKWMIGFAFKTVSLKYTGIFSLILTCFLGGLLYISPKKDLKKFIIVSIFGLIGLLGLIIDPNIKALYFLIPLIVILLIYRFYPRSIKFYKIAKYLLISFLCLGCLILFIVYLNAVNVSFVSDIISSNSFLNYVFNDNSFIKEINVILNASSYSSNMFGISESFYLDGVNVVSLNTGAFEFEIIKEGGMISFVFLALFIILSIFSFISYLKNSKDNKAYKIIILSILFIFIVYNTFLWNPFYLIHNESIYHSFFREPILLIIIFILGFVYYPINSKCYISIEDMNYKKDIYVMSQLNKKEASEKTNEYDFSEGDINNETK